MVQQLEVNQQLQQLPNRTQLEIFCEKHHLITALLSLKNEPHLVLRNIFLQMSKIYKKEIALANSNPRMKKMQKNAVLLLNKDNKILDQTCMDAE